MPSECREVGGGWLCVQLWLCMALIHRRETEGETTSPAFFGDRLNDKEMGSVLVKQGCVYGACHFERANLSRWGC